MSQNVGCLLILCKVTALVETPGVGRVHEEVGWSGQFNDEAAGSGWGSICIWSRVTSFQLNAFNVSEGKFDLVASRVVVDVVGDARFVGRVEDDQIHGVLTNTSPRTNAQRSTCEVLDDDFALSSRITIHHHATTPILCHWPTWTTEELSRERSAGFHGLHGKQLSQGLWEVVAIIAIFQGLLGNHLDLRSTTAAYGVRSLILADSL